MRDVYFDCAATSFRKPPSVRAAAERAMRTCSSPGRGGYGQADRAARAVFRCRETAARLFNVPDPERVALTMNATHALNIAINSVLGPGETAAVSGYEHNSVMRPLRALGAKAAVIRSALFRPDEFLDKLEAELRRGAIRAVICTHVSNVFGYVLPVEEAARLAREHGAAFVLDASQSAGVLPVNYTALGGEFIAMPGHKGLYGPQGTGLLLCGAEARPLLFGGTGSESMSPLMPDMLPDRLEAGTHNVPGAAGLEAGMRFVLSRGEENLLAGERRLMGIVAAGLEALPGVRTFRARDPALQTGVLSFTVDGADSETVAELLARRGVAVRAGLHCAPQAHITAGTAPGGTVRLSFGAFNTAGEAAAFGRAMKNVIKSLK